MDAGAVHNPRPEACQTASDNSKSSFILITIVSLSTEDDRSGRLRRRFLFVASSVGQIRRFILSKAIYCFADKAFDSCGAAQKPYLSHLILCLFVSVYMSHCRPLSVFLHVCRPVSFYMFHYSSLSHSVVLL